MFDPATVTIGKGENVTFVNNAGFPHNVVFDEDEVPVSFAAWSLNTQLTALHLWKLISTEACKRAQDQFGEPLT